MLNLIDLTGLDHLVRIASTHAHTQKYTYCSIARKKDKSEQVFVPVLCD